MNFFPFHMKVKHDKILPFFWQELGSHGKVKVTIKGQTIDFLHTILLTAEANFSKIYRKVKHNEKTSPLKM